MDAEHLGQARATATVAAVLGELILVLLETGVLTSHVWGQALERLRARHPDQISHHILDAVAAQLDAALQ
jgi:cytochrome c-type biogenesis protein CcmH/NrfG